MGRHTNKMKSKQRSKELSEADAAAGMIVSEEPAAVVEEETPPKEKEKRPREPEKKIKLTRKQKRQKLNDKNKWPQHPKITNPEQREKAYLRVAGIEAISEEQEDKAQFPTAEKDKVQEEDDSEWRRFGRFLGGTDARTRHKAVKRLGQYLQAKSGFGLSGSQLEQVVGLSEMDLLKLWKGLWFTLYMADKAPVQDELAKHIAKLIWCVAGNQEDDDFAAQAYLDMEAMEEMELEQAKLEDEENGDGDDDDNEDGDVKLYGAHYVEMEDSDEDSEEGSDSDDGKLTKREKAFKEAKKKLKKEIEDHDAEEDDDDDDDEEEDSDEDPSEEELNGEDDEEDPQEAKHIRGAPLAMLFIRTFLRTLVREWGNMDKYRIDKFYTLTRYMVREVYRYMAQRQWSLAIIKLFNDAVREEALMKQPNGVRYHLIDIALDELVLVATKSGVLPVTEAIFLEILEPYFITAQHGFGDKMVQARVIEKILEKFLMEYSVVREPPSDDDEERKSQLEDVHVGTVSKFIFDMGSDEGTLDIHRKSLYEMHKTYERQRKKMGTDIEIGTSFQQGEVEENDEDYEVEDMDGEEEDEEDLEAMGFVAEEAVEVEEDQDDDEAPAAEEPESKKGKKKKTNKKSKQADATNDVDETPSKQNRQAKKDTDMDTTNHSKATSAKKEKKNKKKKHAIPAKEDEEEVVTISKAEQKKAQDALKVEPKVAKDEEQNNSGSSKKKKKSKSKKQDEGCDKKRRVSFGDTNTARSYKKSMKGLMHLNPSQAASKTPEKSILLNKEKKPRSSSAPPKSRKRAVDYF